MIYSVMCDKYGINPEMMGQIPTPPVENRQIKCKIEVIDWCGWMRQTLDSIEMTFRGAPVNSDEQHAENMERVRDQMRSARIELDRVLMEIYR